IFVILHRKRFYKKENWSGWKRLKKTCTRKLSGKIRSRNMKIRLTILLAAMTTWVTAQDNGIILEELAAKLGADILLASELLSNRDYQTAVSGGLRHDVSCQVIQCMFLNKLMVDQAKLDSMVVPDAQVE